MGTLYKAPYVFQFPVGLPGTNIPIKIEAWDVAGNVATKTVVVDIG
jgi:hypothetical protein